MLEASTSWRLANEERRLSSSRHLLKQAVMVFDISACRYFTSSQHRAIKVCASTADLFMQRGTSSSFGIFIEQMALLTSLTSSHVRGENDEYSFCRRMSTEELNRFSCLRKFVLSLVMLLHKRFAWAWPSKKERIARLFVLKKDSFSKQDELSFVSLSSYTCVFLFKGKKKPPPSTRNQYQGLFRSYSFVSNQTGPVLRVCFALTAS